MYTVEVFVILQAHLLSAIAAALIARFRNRDPGKWFFFSFFPLSILGPIILAWLPRVCPKCGESMLWGADRCYECEE